MKGRGSTLDRTALPSRRRGSRATTEGALDTGRRGDRDDPCGCPGSIRRAVPADLLDLRLFVGGFARVFFLAGIHVDVALEDTTFVDHQVRLLESQIADDPPGRVDLQLVLDM